MRKIGVFSCGKGYSRWHNIQMFYHLYGSQTMYAVLKYIFKLCNDILELQGAVVVVIVW